MKVFCLDTETSAGSQTGRVVQFAIVDQTYREEWLINPQTRILPGTIKVHRITPEMVEDKPIFTESDGYGELIKRLDSGEVLIAHHAPFDVQILENEGVTVTKYIDTCKVARTILKEDGVPRFGLQFLKDYFDLERLNSHDTLTGYAHSALYDTVVLYWLYKYLYKRIESCFPGQDPHELMYRITHDVIPMRRLNFGKYKGKKIEDIAKEDQQYLKWLYKSEMKNSPVRRKKSLLTAIEQSLNIEIYG